MLTIGIVGYLIRKIDIPMGPIVLALLRPDGGRELPPQNGNVQGDYTVFFTRPIAATLFLFSLISVVGTVILERKGNRIGGEFDG